MIRRTDEPDESAYVEDVERDWPGDGPHVDHWASAPDHHRQAAHRRLVDAHDQAVDGPPNPGRVQTGLSRLGVPADPTLQNQHYRNSVGSPHHAGAGARADNPNMELLAADFNERHPRESHSLTPTSADAFLGRRTAPVTSTRVRPSDYGDE